MIHKYINDIDFCDLLYIVHIYLLYILHSIECNLNKLMVSYILSGLNLYRYIYYILLILQNMMTVS